MPTAADDPSNSESDAPDFEDDVSARSGEVESTNQCASGHSTDPDEKDLGKEDLKARLQRKRWGSRLGRLIWLFLAAMNLYLAYLIISMVT